MNEKNLDYLKDELKMRGFGETIQTDLAAKLKEQPTEFQLSTQIEYKRGAGISDKVDFKLEYKKGEQNEMYFFNRFQATLKNEDPAKEKSQTFYVNRDKYITAKEAYNLLDGRAVNKDMVNKEKESVNAWLQLDFSQKTEKGNFKEKQYHTAYGFEIEKVLDKYPIKELTVNDDRVKLLKSLEKGNTPSVTFVIDGKESKMFVEANPKFKTLNVYDEKMQKVFQGNEKKEVKEPEKAKEKKEDIKQENDDDEKKGKKKGKGVGV